MLHVLTRGVSGSISNCELTCIGREPIDAPRMCEQHRQYTNVFRRAAASLVGEGSESSVLNLNELPPLDSFADSMFVEDVALIFENCAVVTRPGAPSRRGEVEHITPVLQQLMDSLQRPLYSMQEPGTVDGGDVLIIGRDVFVGRSTRSNDDGFAQLKGFIAKHGYSAHQVQVRGCLHLKSAASMVTPRTVLINPKWIERTTFTSLGYGVLDTAVEEPHSANVLSFVLRSPSSAGENTAARSVRTIVVPAAFPKLVEKFEKYCQSAQVDGGEELRMEVIEVDEIAKAEGALTCGSLLCYA